ncbi:MAG TPA: DUF4249 domain-containing protein [Bacteroidia bacterium]|nr:DUF4249 domain-containing protein [Bacteroidia bacterium]
MKKYLIYIIPIVVVFFSSCEEDINLDIAAGEQKIVIEGNIESDNYAQVTITRNSPLSQAVDFSNILVKDAKVYVSNGSIVDTLKLDTLFTTAVPFVYVGSRIKGTPGQTYNLTVIVDNKTYTASTLIPQPIPLDTVWWKAAPPEVDYGTATAKLNEPEGYGNCYKWFSKLPFHASYDTATNTPKIQNRRYLSPSGSTFDDKFIDGKNFEFSYYKPMDPTEPFQEDVKTPEEQRRRNLFKKTDTIYIKFCTLDDKAATFYKTFEAASQSSGNPFASPSRIISNINGGALGVWAGFGATYDTIMPAN